MRPLQLLRARHDVAVQRRAGATLGPQLDGTYRMHARGEDLGQMCLLGTFAKHTVVPVKSVVKIDEGFPCTWPRSSAVA